MVDGICLGRSGRCLFFWLISYHQTQAGLSHAITRVANCTSPVTREPAVIVVDDVVGSRWWEVYWWQ